MPWRRHGLVLKPQRLGAWAASHAAVPVVGERGSALELFYSPRDESGRSFTARAEIDLDQGRFEARPQPEPVLAPGELGAFDDSGAMGSCVVAGESSMHLYYIGWNKSVTVPFATFIGCAVSTDGRAFERVSRAPVLGRNDHDPFLATSPWVLVDDGRWRMWYASGVRWEPTKRGPKHLYRIVYAESIDGITWEPTGRICIDFADANEYAIARPCVVRDPDLYRMWFTYRGDRYRIGYAESTDGLTWTRDDTRGGLAPGNDDWESDEVAYPFVFDHAGARWMLYNGNAYGATGIGLARWEPA